MVGDQQAVRLRLVLPDPPGAVSASDEIEQLLGFPPEVWLTGGVRLWDCIHSDDRAAAAPILAPDLSNASGGTLLRIRHADGRIRCIRTEYAKEQDGDGRVVLDLKLRAANTCSDPELLAALHCFRSLTDCTDDYMYLKDRNHVFLTATRSMSDFVRDAEAAVELAGKTVYELFPESMADVLYGLDRKVLVKGERTNEIQELLRADGSHCWIDNRKYPLKNGEGQVIGIFGICPNITQPLDAERKLRESRDLLQLFVEHAPAALSMLDHEMRYLAVSRRWLQDFNLVEEEVLGRSHYEVFPRLPESWKVLHQRALAGEAMRINEDSFTQPDGSVHWLRREYRPWRTADGSVGGILAFVEEITREKRDREQLELAASVFREAHEGIVICDPQGAILDVNETFTRVTGYSRDEALGRNPRMLKSGRQSAEFYQDMWRALQENGQWSGEMWNRAKDGRIYPERLKVNAVYDQGGQVRHYVGLFSDITREKEHEQVIARMAHYDALTNLPNRTLFADRLQQAMAHAHRRRQTLAVVCVDLDGFRSVNERCGHDAGDHLLTELGARMAKVLREGDTLARIGGDKFAATILDVGERKSARHLLERLLAAASQQEVCGRDDVRISASMGVAYYSHEQNIDAGHLLRQAEQAMYQAKLAGKNRCQIFDPAQDVVLHSQEEELEEIRQAFDRGELVLYYQPCVNMSTGALVRTEALVRWQHPARGLLPPAEFLPVIEDHELIDRLGEWAIESVLAQMEVWRAAGLETPISVNIAAHHLQQPDFVDRLRLLLDEHPRVRPGWLELEVLESSALRDVAQVSNVLAQCRELGVSIALDDFGTGYSSLTWLRRLPVNILKIDQSFVREMLDNPDDLTILEGVLSLAAAFDRLAVAEGVETVEHGRLLLQLGCVYGQGYGIARPMPADQIPAWRAAWQPDPSWVSVGSAGPGHRGLLQAAVAHRAWTAGLEAFLRGERHVPPPPDPHRCRFSLWLERERQGSGGLSTAMDEMDRLHRQIHHFANRLSAPEWKSLGVDAQLTQVRRLSDSFAAQLDRVLQDG